MVRFTRSGGLWPPPQSIDIIPQILLLLRVFSHGSHSSCCVYSPTDFTEFTLSLQKNATQSHKLQNDQGKTMIAKDSFVPLL